MKGPYRKVINASYTENLRLGSETAPEKKNINPLHTT